MFDSTNHLLERPYESPGSVGLAQAGSAGLAQAGPNKQKTQHSPSSNVITVMGSLNGPIPAAVAAAILTV